MSYEDAARDFLIIMRERVVRLKLCPSCKRKVLREINYLITVIDERKLEKLKKKFLLF